MIEKIEIDVVGVGDALSHFNDFNAISGIFYNIETGRVFTAFMSSDDVAYDILNDSVKLLFLKDGDLTRKVTEKMLFDQVFKVVTNG